MSLTPYVLFSYFTSAGVDSVDGGEEDKVDVTTEYSYEQEQTTAFVGKINYPRRIVETVFSSPVLFRDVGSEIMYVFQFLY